MTKNKFYLFIGILIVAAIAVFILMKTAHKTSDEITEMISPVMGNIQTSITSTATVQPQNRLEIKPPINGRVEKILVHEGDIVKDGQTLALMSSTERAALLDAAQARGAEAIKYWEDVYKPTPLLSPIDGEVIVSKDYPGQTITTADVVVVLSDHLIVQAQVDETDIGKIKLDQEVTLSLDAYPQIKIKGKVNHIYYESLIVNNVTIYQVDILPDKVPPDFRSGMSATVNIVETAKDNVLILPAAAVKRGKEGTYVLMPVAGNEKSEEHKIETGISDDKNVEIISGLTDNDKVLLITQKYKASSGKSSTNPLNPMARRR
ncbi:MAG: efflux RND transporter periplasmic adaptor subunit [Candidatus Omnitrophota bacterium]|nr:efflux RND transporter periplasmic adaptor subunit [Candidatus Omnitrophota bacterium]